MTQDRFIRENTQIWDSLEKTVAATGGAVTFEEVHRLHRLYRVAAGHLSYARTNYPDSQVCHYLNQLVTSAHNRLHIKRQKGSREFAHTLLFRLPAVVRQNRRFVFVAIGAFILFGLYGYLFTWYAPDSVTAFLPQEFLGANNSPGAGSADWDGAVMSSTIMINNIMVSLRAFGMGLLFGLGAIFILAYNAMILGALAAYVTAAGNGLVFWSLILPHGIWELYAICLSGAAGMLIGFALLRPGQLSRRNAVVLAGRQAVPLMVLVIILLAMAGIVEGFFTPANIPPALKLLFSGLALVMLSLYLFFGGRGWARRAALAADI